MYLIYFDEVKDDVTTQKHFWVGGIIIEGNLIKPIERAVSEISEEHFDTPCLERKTEFHAAEIFHRKNNFNSWRDPIKRISLIGTLLRILDNEAIKKIYVKIEKKHFNSKFSTKKIDEMAFMLFCEKANELMNQLSDIGMLIGDRESTSIASKYAECLSNWRNYRTDYFLGKEIKNLIDTVHFTESHLSRMLQLADIHICCRQFRSINTESKKEINQRMLKEISRYENALFAHKYKEYPLNC